VPTLGIPVISGIHNKRCALKYPRLTWTDVGESRLTDTHEATFWVKALHRT
jgi:hypothetical protein